MFFCIFSSWYLSRATGQTVRSPNIKNYHMTIFRMKNYITPLRLRLLSERLNTELQQNNLPLYHPVIGVNAKNHYLKTVSYVSAFPPMLVTLLLAGTYLYGGDRARTPNIQYRPRLISLQIASNVELESHLSSFKSK